MPDKLIDPRSRATESKTDSLFRSESARDLFTSLYKRRGLYWTIFIVFAIGFYIMAQRIPVTYTATARVKFDSRLETTITQDVDNPEFAKYRPMTTPDVAAEILLFQAREIREAVANHPDVISDPPLRNMPEWSSRSEEDRVRAWMNYMYDHFTVEGVPNTNLVVLKFEDWQSERAARMANLLGQAYVDHRTGKFADPTLELEALNKDLDEAGSRLDVASDSLDTYRGEHRLSSNSIDDATAKLQDSRSQVAVRLAESKSDLASKLSRRDAVVQIDPARQDLIKAMPEVSNNALIASLEDEIRIFRARYHREKLHSMDAHDPVILLKGELEDAMARHAAAVQSAYEGLIYQLETAVGASLAAVNSFEEDRAAIDAEIFRLAQLNTELDRLVIDYDNKRDAFKLAEKRLSVAETRGARTPEVKVSLAASASVPKKPSMPPPVWLISVLSVALGLFLALTTVFVAGYLDRTLDTPGEAERELGMPVLATIQNERGFKRKRRRR